MAITLYVANLPYTMTADDLRTLFEGYGDVRKVNMPLDQATGRPRGIGFVEMADERGAQTAQEALNLARHEGRELRVSRARAQP